MKRVALALVGVFLSYSLAVAGPYGYGGCPGPMMKGFGQSQYPSQNITEAKAKDMIRQFLDTNVKVKLNSPPLARLFSPPYLFTFPSAPSSYSFYLLS